MIFPAYTEELQLWRQVTPSGLLVDKAWTLITTIEGLIEPIVGDEEFLNNQTFANVTEICICDIGYKGVVQTYDGIVDSDGIQRKVVGVPEVWKGFLPHVVLKLERAQWTVIT